jgi:hypothetical protein
MDKLQPYCPGTGCPLKENCMRYRDNIDVKKEPHFPKAPYSILRAKCEFYVGDPTAAVKSILEKSIDESEPLDGAYCD